MIFLQVAKSWTLVILGYNFYREWCGLGRARSFEDLVDIEPSIRIKFKKLYKYESDCMF